MFQDHCIFFLSFSFSLFSLSLSPELRSGRRKVHLFLEIIHFVLLERFFLFFLRLYLFASLWREGKVGKFSIARDLEEEKYMLILDYWILQEIHRHICLKISCEWKIEFEKRRIDVRMIEGLGIWMFVLRIRSNNFESLVKSQSLSFSTNLGANITIVRQKEIIVRIKERTGSHVCHFYFDIRHMEYLL